MSQLVYFAQFLAAGEVVCHSVNAGGGLAPGTATGTLTVSNSLTLSAGSTVLAEINAQSLTNDFLRCISNVAYAGTLSVSNVAGVLAGGQTFKLFGTASSTGTFSNLSPASPGPNLAWSFNPTNGAPNLVALPPPQITRINLGTGGGFTLSGTGPAGRSYRVLATTNLLLPLINWTLAGTGAFTNGTFNLTDSQTTNYLQCYYRVTTP